ncbi:MAG: RluA family pseudouridine synthase [Atopobiaceae bacterium]|nr:RluA family pseudouridine synthase [Atopobiaceae bacterium]
MGEAKPYALVDATPGAVRLRVRESTDAQALLLALGCSRATASRALSEGRLTVGGHALLAREALPAGAVVRLAFLRTAPAGTAAMAPAAILYEDRFLLAADKPAGLLVHGDGTGAETLSDRVGAHLAREGIPASAQAIQRLDVDTTGLVLFSPRRGGSSRRLTAWWPGVGSGSATSRSSAASTRRASGSSLVPIGRDRHDARRMRVGASGKPAVTRASRIASSGGRSLLLVEILTGRRHQIRVHLASQGFPIEGDPLYGGVGGSSDSRDGLMLHAYEERLAHPVTGEALVIRTPWPERFGRSFPEMTIGE